MHRHRQPKYWWQILPVKLLKPVDQIAELYGYRNDKDHAFEWLERAHRQRDAGLPALRTDVLLKNLHSDPRWDPFLHTMGLADDQLKIGER